MNSASSQGGFTIVETLIVLAITGLMLGSAIALISGQQARVQFTQSMQDIQAVIQQTMNEVGAGFYPSTGNIRCTPNGNSVSLTTGTREQGSNTGCIFVGKAIQFASDGANGQEFIIHSLAGRQEADSGIVDADRTLADARPTAIARGQVTNTSTDTPDASDRRKLLYGVRAVDMSYINGNSFRKVGAVAFVNGLGSFQDAQLVSGTQQLSLVPVNNSQGTNQVSRSPEQVVDAINTQLMSSPLNPTNGVTICFTDDSNRRSGLITIGSNGRGLSVKLDFKDSGNCT